MKKWIIVIGIALLLIGILFFVTGDDEQILGDNYFYLPEYEAVDVGYPGGAIIYKSPQKNLFREIKIHNKVLSVAHNRDFILAIQQPMDSLLTKKESSNVSDNKVLNYFIIVKKSDSIYGPLSKPEYLQKRKELNIPEDLKLDNSVANTSEL
jgi:hypothetical protein